MALTKVAGDILDPGLSIAGVVTATAFDGPFRGGSGSDVTAGVGCLLYTSDAADE